MAEIDKSLPNEAKLLSPEEEIETVQETEVSTPGGVEVSEGTDIIENEDGSVDINFDPSATGEVAPDHNSNLSDYMDDQFLGQLGSELYSNYEDYNNSRKDWAQAYREGLDLLGFKYEMRSENYYLQTDRYEHKH